jgi:hypothetical protein
VLQFLSGDQPDDQFNGVFASTMGNVRLVDTAGRTTTVDKTLPLIKEVVYCIPSTCRLFMWVLCGAWHLSLGLAMLKEPGVGSHELV